MRFCIGLGIAPGFVPSSIWTPTSPSAPLRGWYKSDVGFTGGGAWLDQSGHGNHFAAQGAGFAASGTLNGRQTILNSNWLLVSAFSLSAAGGITIACVMKAAVTGSLQKVAQYTDALFDEHGFGFDGATTTPGYCFSGIANAADGTTDLHNVWRRVVLTDVAGGNQNLYVDGGASESSQATSGAIADGLQFRLAGPLAAGSLYAAELLVYAGVLTSTDRTNLDTYLKAAWGL